MSSLENLKPQNVFRYFREISAIPRGSYHTKAISDYLVNFAKEHGFEHYQDSDHNVIIIKEASAGYEASDPVIIQGHMDMVCEKEEDRDIDFETEGLDLYVDGDFLKARGTTLGGDDGIAVAYALAVLDDDSLLHPRLEVVITSDEEVGLLGAKSVDLSMLQGHFLLNIDSDIEGHFLTSCAGGLSARIHIPVAYQKAEGTLVLLRLHGLLGGHSGSEIDKEHANAVIEMGRIIKYVETRMQIGVVSLEGGLKDNAIPRETRAVLLTEEKDREAFCEVVKAVEAEIQAELASKDPGFFLRADSIAEGRHSCVTAEDTKRTAAFLISLPNGVQGMSADMPGLVETSLNLGILKYENGKLLAEFAVRSSVESVKYALLDKVAAVTCLSGGSSEASGDYPGWKYRKDSPLRDKMVAVYREMYGAEPKVEAIHAGLECGILGSKIKDLDCVSLGPDMSGIHTTEETLSIASVRRVWEYLVKLLEKKDA